MTTPSWDLGRINWYLPPKAGAAVEELHVALRRLWRRPARRRQRQTAAREMVVADPVAAAVGREAVLSRRFLRR
jgi:hypothetical protein